MTTELGAHVVPQPMFISARLMAAYRLPDGSTLHVGAMRRDDEGRVVYAWAVDDETGRELGAGTDLRSGCGAPVDYAGIMGTLCAFLGAAAESYGYAMRHPGSAPENLDLFTADVTAWAYQHDDELAMVEYDLAGEDEDA